MTLSFLSAHLQGRIKLSSICYQALSDENLAASPEGQCLKAYVDPCPHFRVIRLELLEGVGHLVLNLEQLLVEAPLHFL